MYTLRQIQTNGVESILSLGGYYTIVRKEHSPEKFKELQGVNVHPKEEEIFAFIDGSGGIGNYPLYYNEHYYILTENGKTLDHLFKAKIKDGEPKGQVSYEAIVTNR